MLEYTLQFGMVHAQCLMFSLWTTYKDTQDINQCIGWSVYTWAWWRYYKILWAPHNNFDLGIA